MIAGGGGSIIFIASQLGRVGSAGRAAYCATKGRADTARQGHGDRSRRRRTSGSTRCRRAAVETQRTLHRYGIALPRRAQTLGAKHLLGRLGRPDEIAARGGISRQRRGEFRDRQRSAGRRRLHGDLNRTTADPAQLALIADRPEAASPRLQSGEPMRSTVRDRRVLDTRCGQADSSCSTRCVAVNSSMLSTAANSRTRRSRAA